MKEAAEQHPQRCQYMRTLEEAGDFCIIKDDWVVPVICAECPASHSSAVPASSEPAPDYRIVCCRFNLSH
jgi:hypothetical protein